MFLHTLWLQIKNYRTLTVSLLKAPGKFAFFFKLLFIYLLSTFAFTTFTTRKAILTL